MIALDSRLCRAHSKKGIEEDIRKIVRNTHFALVDGGDAVRLLGPDMYYHAFDPHLASALERLSPPTSVAEILNYRTHVASMELCLEDSWSGFFIAEYLGGSHNVQDLTIIHLDDHADMMPTLLACRGDELLYDVTTGAVFEPGSPDAWASSILSGAVGIGCFLVPLFYGGWRTHVRHINNAGPDPAGKQGVVRAPVRYDLMPTLPFASVRLRDPPMADDHGTYVVSSSCRAALDDLPDGPVIVHVDLDYFVNDFNGNPRSGNYSPPAGLIDEGLQKLNAFFLALHERKTKVDRWIVATSPGFCCALHWHRLLSAFASQVANYGRSPKSVHSNDYRSKHFDFAELSHDFSSD